MDPLESLSPTPSRWPSEIAELDDRRRSRLAARLVDEWIHGRLEPRLLPARHDAEARTALRHDLAAAVTALGADAAWVRWSALDEASVERWCWIRPWMLCDQDEELLVMADPLMRTLLAQAAAWCPKRDYLLEIVAHHVRDQAFVALAEGPAAVAARLTALAQLTAPARAARADELVAYLARLASYASPQEIGEADAVVRVQDLWRCHPPTSVDLALRNREWRARYDEPLGRACWIVIDARTGALRLDG